MKNKIAFPFLFAILLTGLFSSCEQNADIDLPETKPKLVLAAFITPQDTMLKVNVTRSRPIFESYQINTNSAVANATVTMSSNAGSVQLIYDAIRECYTASASAFPITAGTTYSLTVTTPEGESAEATTTVPVHNVQGFSVTIEDSLTFDVYVTHLNTKFTHRVNDFSGEANYYRFFSAIIFRDTVTSDTSSLGFANELFTDNNADGQQLQHNLEGSWSIYDPSDPRKVIGYDCWMFNVDIHYYRFHNSLQNYSGDDPFSEPTIIYTNVKDGLGVFASANGTKIRIYR